MEHVLRLAAEFRAHRGKSKGRISQTPWGIPTKGYRTRKTTRTDQYIRLSRHKVGRGH